MYYAGKSLKQARTALRLAHPWFLRIVSVWTSICVYVFVCVCPPPCMYVYVNHTRLYTEALRLVT